MNDHVVEVLFGTFALLMVLGAPITVALGVAALAAMFYLGDNPIKMVQMAWSSVGSFPLMALPSFILAGALMEAAGLSRRLIAVAESLAVPFTGGLSAATAAVFPTSSQANPTLTIVALALRLAGHLKEQLRPAAAVVHASPSAG